MINALEITYPLVSVHWLMQNLDASNLVLLDATIDKVTANEIPSEFSVKIQIKNARFLDLKNKFSDTASDLPNTMLSPKEFEEAAKQLGIDKNSAIVVYDDLGIYSSPRVWWMFKAMGHHNIAVLDGGLPEWIKAGLPIEKASQYRGKIGNFTSDYNKNYMSDRSEILMAIKNENLSVLDARSINRFNGTEIEPREGLRSGHIPNSINLPYTELIEQGKMKPKEILKTTFSNLEIEDSKLIFSCGSGITACILALGAELLGLQHKSVYDGSWTEWGSLPNDIYPLSTRQ